MSGERTLRGTILSHLQFCSLSIRERSFSWVPLRVNDEGGSLGTKIARVSKQEGRPVVNLTQIR